MLSIQTFLARRLTKVRLRVKIYLHTHEAFLRERNKAVDRPSGLEKVYANFPGTETMNASLAIQHLLHNLPSAAIETFLALFPIVNPLGGIPLFFSLTADYTPEERRHTALTTAL